MLEKSKSISLFDYLDSINLTKEDLLSSENEKDYPSYSVNHFLSGNIDTIFYANKNNCRPFLDKRLQYDYLRFSIKKKFRRSKWLKLEKIEQIKLVQQYYGYSYTKAKEALRLLSDQQLDKIRKFLDVGGTK